MRIVFWISWFTFLLVIIRMQYQVSKVTKQMAADHIKERLDRAIAMTEIQRTTESLARRTEMIAELVKEDTEELKAAIVDNKTAIKENTAMTKLAGGHAVKAFHEANSINRKLHELGLEQNVLLHEQKAQEVKDKEQADSIQETGEDSNRMLKDEKPQ